MLSAHSRFRWPSRAARCSAGVRGGRGASRQAAGSIICLRLSCELSAGIAGPLGDAVSARLAAAATPAGTVVLELSAAATVDDQALAALQSLHRRLADLTVRLRLVAPRPNVYAALHTDDIDIGPDALHTSVRTAVLAAHADGPGPASVTPALRMLLTQPPELLSLAEVSDSNDPATITGRDPQTDLAVLKIQPTEHMKVSHDLGGISR